MEAHDWWRATKEKAKERDFGTAETGRKDCQREKVSAQLATSYTWLVYKDEKMFCTTCKENGGEPTCPFVIGSANFKLESVKAHASSKLHRKLQDEIIAKKTSFGTSPAEKCLYAMKGAKCARVSRLFHTVQALGKLGASLRFLAGRTSRKCQFSKTSLKVILNYLSIWKHTV